MRYEGNEIINNLIPYKENRADYTGLGSEAELEFHIENAALKHLSGVDLSPMGLMFTCVHEDENGPATRVGDARLALRRLTRRQRDILRSPAYKIKVPHRWRDTRFGAPPTMTDWVAVLNGREGDYPDISAVFYKDMIHAEHADAAEALAAFHRAIKDISLSISLKLGRLVYIDNRFALHARDKFTPSFDDEGRPARWIQRVFVSQSLWSYRNLVPVSDRVYEVS